MPVHRVPKGSVHEDVTKIERESERIVSVSVDGDYFVIFTEFRHPPIERRVVEHGGGFA